MTLLAVCWGWNALLSILSDLLWNHMNTAFMWYSGTYALVHVLSNNTVAVISELTLCFPALALLFWSLTWVTSWAVWVYWNDKWWQIMANYPLRQKCTLDSSFILIKMGRGWVKGRQQRGAYNLRMAFRFTSCVWPLLTPLRSMCRNDTPVKSAW